MRKNLEKRWVVIFVALTILIFTNMYALNKINFIENVYQNEINIAKEVKENIKVNYSNLLSCPFCGGKAVLKESDLYGYEAKIICEGCEVYINSDMAHENTAEEAKRYVTSKWNSRVN